MPAFEAGLPGMTLVTCTPNEKDTHGINISLAIKMPSGLQRCLDRGRAGKLMEIFENSALLGLLLSLHLGFNGRKVRCLLKCRIGLSPIICQWITDLFCLVLLA